MDIDEAIKHAEEVAEQNEKQAEIFNNPRYSNYGKAEECAECAAEHRQLAEWLKELKQRRQAIEDIKAEIEIEIQDCQIPQGHDAWWNGKKYGLEDALEIIDKHISGAKMVAPQEKEK